MLRLHKLTGQIYVPVMLLSLCVIFLPLTCIAHPVSQLLSGPLSEVKHSSAPEEPLLQTSFSSHSQHMTNSPDSVPDVFIAIAGGVFLGLWVFVFFPRKASASLGEDHGDLAALALSVTGDNIWVWNCQTDRFQYAQNTVPVVDSGLQPQETPRSMWERLIHPDDRGHFSTLLDDCVMGRSSHLRVEYRIQDAKNQWKWILSRGQIIERDRENRPLRMLGTHVDITANKRGTESLQQKCGDLEAELSLAQSALRQETEACKRAAMELQLANQVFKYSQEGIMITDAQRQIIKINAAFTNVTGYMEQECVGRHPRFLQSGIHDVAFYEKIGQAIREKHHWEGEIWNRRKNGEAYPQWLMISVVENKHHEVTHYIALFHDMTDVKDNQEQIKYQTSHDALTGLPNRQLFQDHLEMAVAQAQRHNHRVGVMFLDVDNFKNINDALGHHIGDLLLKEVAKRLKACCRNVDTVARVGGDEFMIILPDIKPHGQDTVEVAERIMASLTPPFLVEGYEIVSTASIGITIYPGDGRDVAALIKNADIAMFRAKEQGRNRYVLYTKSMQERILERLDLENKLRKALQHNEFTLYYQPQIDMKTGEIYGIEALVRWQPSPDTLIGPDKFIPLAEETGLIFPLGEWVLRTACCQTKLWHEAGFDWLTIAVNLSAKQFQDPQLVQIIHRILHETGLDPKFLCLEITENTVMKDIEAAVNMMFSLEKIGVQLSIDDFGTGYSSLSYLKNFPLTEIKIDKSFVQDIPCDNDGMAIAKAILSLAHSLNLKVLAEGVETRKQLDFMRINSCDGIQGFLFSKPIAPDALTSLLQMNRNFEC